MPEKGNHQAIRSAFVPSFLYQVIVPYHNQSPSNLDDNKYHGHLGN